MDRCPRPGRLTLTDQEEITLGLHARDSFIAIAARLGKAVSTVSREVTANGGREGYRAWRAHQRAREQARRPKMPELACPELAAQVTTWLAEWWSPVQIAARLRIEHPGDPIMRPAEAEDRAVPGHWEGDLIIGGNLKSAVGTPVERTTRYVLLLHLPGGRDARLAGQAMRRAITALPAGLARTITWDQGKEMAYHAGFTIATGIPVCFCDPHKPWQRGSNENTNGPLRQYLPKGTDLSVHSAADLARIAASLNNRPRKTLGFMTPSEKLAELLAHTG